ncbi:MAG: hypothetical protein IJS96_01215 [Schwartzia sp.]|nr:hypothetical protein [Schwartzia sp. (in: firmicutes)]
MKVFGLWVAAVLCFGVWMAIPGGVFANGVSLDGAWKPRDYGTRIEIDGDTMLILWMNRPALETKFTVTEEDGKTVLHLEKTGLREPGDKKDYAQITGLWIEDGVMHFVKVFDIAGEKVEFLSPTTESRYGNVTVVTEKELPRLEGLWKTKDAGGYTLKIEGEALSWRFAQYEWEGPVAIAVVHENWEKDPDRFTVRAKDPAREYIGFFTTFDYRDGKLHTEIPVYDAESPRLVFEKVE